MATPELFTPELPKLSSHSTAAASSAVNGGAASTAAATGFASVVANEVGSAASCGAVGSAATAAGAMLGGSVMLSVKLRLAAAPRGTPLRGRLI
jgi:hypothetical protein